MKRDDLTIKQKLSDTKLLLSHTHMHMRSPICLVPITHLHRARRMAHFRAVRISCSTRASCSLILYCYSMNSGGPKQQEMGTHVTALTLWPRYQPSFCWLVGFFLYVCYATDVSQDSHSLPQSCSEHLTNTHMEPFSYTPAQEGKTFTGFQ